MRRPLLFLYICLLGIQATAQSLSPDWRTPLAAIDKHLVLVKRMTRPVLFQMNESGPRGGFQYVVDSIVTTGPGGMVFNSLEFKYDSEGRPVEGILFSLNESTQVFGLESVVTLEYNDQGYLSRFISENYDTQSQTLTKELEVELWYDSAGRPDSAIGYSWDQLMGEFGPVFARKNVYDQDLVTTKRLWAFVSFPGEWLLSQEAQYTYNSIGKPAEIVLSGLDLLSGNLEPYQRFTISYTSSGTEEEFTQYDWLPGLQTWEPFFRQLYEYYPTGTLHLVYGQHYETGAWQNLYRILQYAEDIYDYSSVTNNYWNAAEEQWDSNDSSYAQLLPSISPDQVANIALTHIADMFELYIGTPEFQLPYPVDFIRNYYWFDDSYRFSEQETYYYSQLEPSGVSETLPAFISIVPNPASDHIMISLDEGKTGTYFITMPDGKFVAKGTLAPGTNFIATSARAPGIYIVVIRLDDGGVYAHRQVIGW